MMAENIEIELALELSEAKKGRGKVNAKAALRYMPIAMLTSSMGINFLRALRLNEPELKRTFRKFTNAIVNAA